MIKIIVIVNLSHRNPTPDDSSVEWTPYTTSSPNWLQIDRNPSMVHKDTRDKVR